MSRLSIAFFLTLVLAAAAIASLPSYYDWNQLRPAIAQQMQALSGRAFSIQGPITFAWLPKPTISLADVRLANLPSSQTPDMVHAKQIEAAIDIAALLTGQFKVTAMTVVEPTILLETLGNGAENWQFRPGEAAAADSDIAIENVRVQNGHISYRGADGQIRLQLNRADLEGFASSLSGPFQIDGQVLIEGQAVGLQIALGALRQGQPTALRLSLSAGEAAQQLGIVGNVHNDGSGTRITGRMQARVNRAETIQQLHFLPPALQRLAGAFADQALTLDGKIDWQGTNLAMQPMNLNIGTVRATGRAEFDATQSPQLQMNLRVRRLDGDGLLQAWSTLAASAAASPTPIAGQEATNNEAGASATGTDGQAERPRPGYWQHFNQNISGHLQLAVDAIRLNEATIRNSRLGLHFRDSNLHVSQLRAALPGDTLVAIDNSDRQTTVATALDTATPVAGQLRAQSTDPRSLLRWLGLETGAIRAGRLNRLGLQGQLSIAGDVLQIADLEMQVDQTHINGGIAYLLQRRPSFSVDLNIDKLNLDNYFFTQPTIALHSNATPDADTNSAVEAQAAVMHQQWQNRLHAWLTNFDTDLRVNLGELTYQRLSYRGLVAELGLFQQVLNLQQITVADHLGTSVTAHGQIKAVPSAAETAASGVDEEKSVTADLKIRMQSTDLPLLLQGMGQAHWLPYLTLKEAEIDGHIYGDLGQLYGTAQLRAPGLQAELNGRFDNLDDAYSATMSIASEHHDLAALAVDLGLRSEKAAIAAQPLRLDSEITISAQGMKLEAQALEAKNALTLSALWDFKPRPTLAELQAALQHDDIATFLGALLPTRFAHEINSNLSTGRDAVADIADTADTAFDGRLHLRRQAGAWQIEQAHMTGMGSVWTADGIVTMLGDRAHLSADIQAEQLDAARLLPALAMAAEWLSTERSDGTLSPRSAAQGDTALSSNLKSRPFQYSALAGFDANLNIVSNRLQIGITDILDAQSNLQLRDGVMTLPALTGWLYDGRLEAVFAMDIRRVPKFRLDAKIADAELQQALPALLGAQPIRGRFHGRAQVESNGQDMTEILRRLDGNMRINSLVGLIDNFNLAEAARQFEAGDFDEDVFLQALLSPGETAYLNLESNWRISGGFAEADAVQMDLQGGHMTVRGAFDLLRNDLGLQGQLMPKSTQEGPPINLHLDGALSAPDIYIDMRALQRFLRQRT